MILFQSIKTLFISKYWCWILFRDFQDMVIIFSSPLFYTNYVQLPMGTDPVLPKIANNPKFFPYFKDAVDAINGSHLHVTPPPHRRPFYPDCNGSISMNCLFACSFAPKFIYALTGWEGSAADGLLWHDALQKGLVIPDGKYLLTDAWFSGNPKLLTPYHGVQYHLAEWGHTHLRFIIYFWFNPLSRPATNKELFSLHHAQLCNVIEHIFGVLK